jgi:hypothetical protein
MWGRVWMSAIVCNTVIICICCIAIRPWPSVPIPHVVPHGHIIWSLQHHVGRVLMSLWLLHNGLLIHHGLYHNGHSVLNHGHCNAHVCLVLVSGGNLLSVAAAAGRQLRGLGASNQTDLGKKYGVLIVS